VRITVERAAEHNANVMYPEGCCCGALKQGYTCPWHDKKQELVELYKRLGVPPIAVPAGDAGILPI
jgi:hypothetical protein